MNAIVEAFEDAYTLEHGANLRDYLPEQDHPNYTPITVELIRVDLERARAEGIRRQLEDYRDIAPALFGDPVALGQIAYEEFRLRRLAGEMISVDEYAQRFALDTESWAAPIRDSAVAKSHHSGASSGNGAQKQSGRKLPSAGDQFAGFELVELLGRGAFGVVFRARQHDLAQREVVLKLSALRSVEPQRLARLQHTNIMPIYSVHQEFGCLGICMPFLGCSTLADVLRGNAPSVGKQAQRSTVAGRNADTVRLRESSPVEIISGRSAPVMQGTPVLGDESSINQIVDWISQLAEGLAHAHGRGIIHSDLKPANVLLADDGTPLLLDFNLSDDVNSVPAATLMVGGTLPYMAPEHLAATLSGGLARAQSDIYSLGAIFFELLTGQRPYRERAGSTDEQLEEMIRDRQQTAPSVRSFDTNISPSVAAIVAHCLEPLVDNRYSSASELAEDLRRHQHVLPLKHAHEPSVPERFRKWLRRNARGVRVASMFGLIALLAGVATLAVVRQQRVQNLLAVTEFSKFQGDALTAHLNLHSPGREPELKSIGRAAATAALGRFGFDGANGAAANPLFIRLRREQQDEIREESFKLQYAMAETAEQRQQAIGNLAESSDAQSYVRGIQLLEQGNYAGGVHLWEKLSMHDRRDPTRWLLLGNAYRGLGRLTDADACYTVVIALQPQAMAGYLYRGQCRLEMQKYPNAEADFTAVLELRPGMPCGLMNRALVWHAMGASDNAERDATAAIVAGLKDPRAFFVRANVRESLGNVAGAKADREIGFVLEPIDEFGWIARGIARLKEKPDLAQFEFESGLSKFPNSIALQENLIYVYADRLQQLDSALAIANRRVEKDPNNLQALTSRAVILARLGRRDEAHRDAKRVAQHRLPPTISLQLACAYSVTSRTNPSDVDKSLELLKSALAGDPRLAMRAAADPDFEAIRSTVEYTSLLDAATRLVNSSPVARPQTEAAIADHN